MVLLVPAPPGILSSPADRSRCAFPPPQSRPLGGLGGPAYKAAAASQTFQGARGKAFQNDPVRLPACLHTPPTASAFGTVAVARRAGLEG